MLGTCANSSPKVLCPLVSLKKVGTGKKDGGKMLDLYK